MKCENCPYILELCGSYEPVSICIIQIEEGENFTPKDENGFPIEWESEEECRIPDKIEPPCLKKGVVPPLKALISRIMEEAKKYEAE